MRLRTIFGAVAGAGMLLATLPGAAVASSGASAPVASHSVSAKSGAVQLAPSGKSSCKGSSGTDSGTAITSQEFTDLGGFSEIADDFTCTGAKKTRKVTKVSWVGQYYNGSGPADSFNVRIYNNDTSGSIDEPGDVRCEFLNQSYNADGSVPTNFSAKLSGDKCVKLKKGQTYWISIQAVMAFGVGGQFGWENINETNGNEADFLESGLFGTQCTTWANDLTLNDCIGFPGDFIFSF